MYKRIILANIMANHKNINIAETGNIKKEGESEKKKTENSQTKMADRNTRTKKQWRCRTIGKQKLKWHD